MPLSGRLPTDSAGHWLTKPATLMRFRDAAVHLRSLPRPLPPPPASLTPRRAILGSARVADTAGLAEDAFRPSAVLVLVFADEAGEARVLLTARPGTGIRHAGQVSFPGGASDEGDADAVATALRESREEVGLDPDAVGLEVVGMLDPVTIPVSGFRLTPVLALAQSRPKLSPDPHEVSAVFDAPVDRFFPDATVTTVEGVVDDRVGSGPLRIRYAAYGYEGYEIWGATARVLGQLGAILASR